MKNFLIYIFAVIMVIIAFPITETFAQEGTGESDPIGFSLGVDYMSNYLWRGGYWYSGDGAFFPSLSYEIAGLAISYCGEFSEDAVIDDGDNDIKDLHATDLGVDYLFSIGDTLTVGAGVWYFYFHNEDTYSFITGTVSVTLDSVPLIPTLTYNHDYYTDSEDKNDFYIQLGISHDIEIVKGASLEFGLVGAYYNADSTDQKGISDIIASISLSVEADGVTYSSGFNYAAVPSKDFKKDLNGKDDNHRFYGTFGVSYSI